MAKKETETVDRYQIYAETSMEQMGFVLAALTKMGLENIGYNLITDVHQFKSKERTAYDVSAMDFAAEYVKEHPRFKSTDLVAHFKAAGREPGGAYYVMKKMTDANIIRKNGDDFVRVEALAAPEKVAKTRPANATARFEVPNKDLIENAIKGRAGITMRELRELFAKEGRNVKSISPIITSMVKSKMIKAIGPGEYVVLTKGAKPSASVKKPPEKKNDAAEAPASALNGTTMNGTGEAAHG